MAKTCPCKYCVPPKRCSDCHSYCPDYKDWTDDHNKDLEKIREMRKAEDDCFPNRLRKKGRMS